MMWLIRYLVFSPTNRNDRPIDDGQKSEPYDVTDKVVFFPTNTNDRPIDGQKSEPYVVTIKVVFLPVTFKTIESFDWIMPDLLVKEGR